MSDAIHPEPWRFPVMLHDTDAAGVLFFAHLFRHAHDAYEAFMAARGLLLHRIIAEGEWGLPLVHAEADYTRPLHHGDVVAVHLEVESMGERSFTLGYRFECKGACCATARTVHVAVDRSGRAIGLPETVMEILRAGGSAQ